MSALIVGGGVAGLTAAAWLRRYEAPYRWVTRGGDIGGILSSVHNPIIDYPGVYGRDGEAVAATLREWASQIPAPEADDVERVRAVDGGFEVEHPGGSRTYPAVLIATGTRRRLLGIPGEAEGLDRCILTSTTRTPERCVGRRVLMVGGGDAAVEGALNLLDAGAAEVTLLTRSRIRAQRHFVAQFDADPRAHYHPTPATPRAFEPHDDGCRVLLDDGEALEFDLVFVRIGVEPVRPKFDPRPRLDEAGFILVDGRAETDVKGLFAAGDVTSTPLRSIATSVGDGTRAARSIAELLGIWT